MTRKKYELTGEMLQTNRGYGVFRIRALVDIPRHGVKAGDEGGFIHTTDCLPQSSDAWVSDEAIVYRGAKLRLNVLVSDKAVIYEDCFIAGDVKITDDVQIWNSSIQGKEIVIRDRAQIISTKLVGNNLQFSDDAYVSNLQSKTPLEALLISGNARIEPSSDFLFEEKKTKIDGKRISITDNAHIEDTLNLFGNDIAISQHACLLGASIRGSQVSLNGACILNENVRIGDSVSVSDLVTVRSTGFRSVSNVMLTGDNEYWAEKL